MFLIMICSIFTFFSSVNFPLPMILFSFLFFFMIISIIKVSNNSLMIFIYLEMMVLINFFMLNFLFSSEFFNLSYAMVFFSLAVCEASMALSLLVKLMRNFSSIHLPLMYYISLIKPLVFKTKIIST